MRVELQQGSDYLRWYDKATPSAHGQADEEVFRLQVYLELFGSLKQGGMVARMNMAALKPPLNSGDVLMVKGFRGGGKAAEFADNPIGDSFTFGTHGTALIRIKRNRVNVENEIQLRDIRGMSNDHVTHRLKELRNRTGLTMAEVAHALGMRGPSSYQRYEDEALAKSDSVPFRVVKKLVPLFVGKGSPPITEQEVLSLAAGEETSSLLSIGGKMIDVVGRVAAGVWTEDDSDFIQVPLKKIPFTSDNRYPNRRQYARLVEGDSMNRVFPNGSYAVITELNSPAREDDIVVVARQRGGLTERTLKRVRIVGQQIELHPESTETKFEKIVVNGDEETSIEIEGLAIGVYRPL